MLNPESVHESPDISLIRVRVFRTLFLIAFTTQLGIGIISPAMPLYAQMLGIGGFALGLISSSFAIGRTLFMPVGGTISDVWGRKKILLIGLCGYSLFSGCYIFASSIEILLIFRFLHGLSAAFVFPIASAYIGDLTEVGSEARTMGAFMSSAFLGMSFGPVIGGILFEHIGHDAPFITLSVLAGINVLLALIVLPDYRSKKAVNTSIFSVFLHPSLRIPIIFYFSYSLCYAAYISFFSPMVFNEAGMTPSVAGVLMSLTAISMAFFQKNSGKIIDRYPKNYFLSGGMVIMGVMMIVQTLPTSIPPFILICIFLGSGFGLALTAASAMTTIAGRELGQGKSASGVNTAQSLGLMIAPPVLGFFSGTDYSVVFLISGTLCLLSAPLWYWFGKTGGRECV